MYSSLLQIVNSPVQEIKSDFLEENNIQFFIKRDDLIDQQISGNKFRKLKYNLDQARKEGQDTLLTFGGAYSNHIHAVAAAGSKYGFKTIGIIRGEEYNPLNATLSFAASNGMKLHYISRKRYKEKDNGSFLHQLHEDFGRFYLLPEGGSNTEAVRGCSEIIQELDIEYDVITVSCGTGCTMAGILAGLDGKKYVVGFPALKNGDFLKKDIFRFIRSYNDKIYLNWHLETGYHFGGYARYSEKLIDFINEFKQQFQIQLDPIYTGKMIFGIFDLVKKVSFNHFKKIIAIHSGGLQGIKGFNERHGNLIL